MWPFKKWYWMFSFKAVDIVTEPRKLFDKYNLIAPVLVKEDEFSWQVSLQRNILGWVLIRKRSDARKVRRFLKKSGVLRLQSEGQIRADSLDVIRWGIDEPE